MLLTPDTLKHLACSACLGPLVLAAGGDDEGVVDGIAGCDKCGARFPVVAGVPVLVPDPAGWVASYREATLASLAEVGAATPQAVSLLDAFAGAARHPEHLAFGDDWVDTEEPRHLEPPGAGRAVDLVRALAVAARDQQPDDVLLELIGDPASATLEVGSGAGSLTRRLAMQGVDLVAVDLSLRAALRTRRASRGQATVVVGDASSLPVPDVSVGLVVAANLVDLLDHPGAFLDEARRVLTRHGRLALSTPDPGEGSQGLDNELVRAGFDVETLRDGVVWLQVHGDRHLEVYVTQVLVARKT